MGLQGLLLGEQYPPATSPPPHPLFTGTLLGRGRTTDVGSDSGARVPVGEAPPLPPGSDPLSL